MEFDLDPQEVGYQANLSTAGSILQQLLGDPVSNQEQIEELEAKIRVKQVAYSSLLRNKNFKIFLDETLKKVFNEALKHPIYHEGRLHPALGSMNASELALYQAGMQNAVNMIFTDLDKYK